VHVLGAGCSYDEQRGYPLANGFLSELEIYAAKIHDQMDCQQIEKATQQTIRLLKHFQRQAFTVDKLISMILTKECDEKLTTDARAANHTFKYQADLRYQAVRSAKISTAACFLEKEGQAMTYLMPKNQAFIRKIFDQDGISAPYTSSKLQNSNARVLTFNYDRLFELAFFCDGFASNTRNNLERPLHFLNSGLHDNRLESGIVSIEKDRFCLLKMHGSLGMLCEEDDFNQAIYGGEDLACWKQPEVTDEIFRSTHFSSRVRAEPLIAFPWEKHFILDGKDNKASFRDYISAVWNHAKSVFQEASEIYIIGFSFSDEVDSKYLIDLMREAKDCHQIEVQNISQDECDRISNLLRAELGFNGKIKTNLKPFGNEPAELASELNSTKLAA